MRKPGFALHRRRCGLRPPASAAPRSVTARRTAHEQSSGPLQVTSKTSLSTRLSPSQRLLPTWLAAPAVTRSSVPTAPRSTPTAAPAAKLAQSTSSRPSGSVALTRSLPGYVWRFVLARRAPDPGGSRPYAATIVSDSEANRSKSRGLVVASGAPARIATAAIMQSARVPRRRPPRLNRRAVSSESATV